MGRNSNKVEAHEFKGRRGRLAAGQQYRRCSICSFTKFAECHVDPPGPDESDDDNVHEPPRSPKKRSVQVEISCPRCSGTGLLKISPDDLIKALALLEQQKKES